MQPAYRKAYRAGILDTVIDKAFGLLASCDICPRGCQVNRLEDETGFCQTGRTARVYSFMPHKGEEPPVSGSNGSGTIFFAQCNMRCVYCQNFEFSQLGAGKPASDDELAQMMLDLQQAGCHNINLVTPTHVMPQILKALRIAAEHGLNLPLVYNTGGYERDSVIALLKDVIDVYLVDMRYGDEESALTYSAAPGYPLDNQQAVREMHRQVGVAQFDAQGIIERGLIVRHLVLPQNISGTERIMKFLGEEISPDTYVSLMSQYKPYHLAPEDKRINRRISDQEYAAAQEVMHHYGLHNGWVQEGRGLEKLAGVHIEERRNEAS